MAITSLKAPCQFPRVIVVVAEVAAEVVVAVAVAFSVDRRLLLRDISMQIMALIWV